MSNRLLGIIIIIGFIGLGYIYYNMYYIPKKEASLIVEKQVSESEQQKKVELVKLPIEKDIEKTNIQKIEELKEKNKYFLYFELKNGKIAYFKNNGQKIDLYYIDSKIASFDKVRRSDIIVSHVRGTKSDLYIKILDLKYYYDKINNNLNKIDLVPEVLYSKKGNSDKILFYTKKGTFIYSKKTKKLNYFTYFNDLVLLDNYYIGIVNKEDNRRLTNLGFETNKNLIILYNPNTKEKKIIYQTEVDLVEIYIQNNILYMLDNEGKTYNLENFN